MSSFLLRYLVLKMENRTKFTSKKYYHLRVEIAPSVGVKLLNDAQVKALDDAENDENSPQFMMLRASQGKAEFIQGKHPPFEFVGVSLI